MSKFSRGLCAGQNATSKNSIVHSLGLQGVGLSLFLFMYVLKPTIFAQNWHDWAHLDENIHPFVILDHFIRKSYKFSKILNLQKYAIFSIALFGGLTISL